MHHSLLAPKLRRAVLVAILAGLPVSAWAVSPVYDTAAEAAQPQSGTGACAAAQSAAVAQCNSTYQQQIQNMQANVQQPGDLSSQSCLGGILSSATGLFSNIESLANGGGITGMLGSMMSSFGSSLLQQFGSEMCSAVNSQWNNVSSQIDQVANLPTTLGEAAAGQVSQLGQQAINTATGPISGNVIPQVVPNVPSNVPMAPLPPSSGTGTLTNNVKTLGGLL